MKMNAKTKDHFNIGLKFWEEISTLKSFELLSLINSNNFTKQIKKRLLENYKVKKAFENFNDVFTLICTVIVASTVSKIFADVFNDKNKEKI